MFELVLPWDRQPQEPVAPNVEGTFARRLIVAATPQFSAFGSVAHGATFLAGTLAVGPRGISLSGAGSYARVRTPAVTLLGRVTAGVTSEKRNYTAVFVGYNTGTSSWVTDRQGGGIYGPPVDIYRDASGNLFVNTSAGNIFTSVPWPTKALVTIISMGQFDNGAVLPRVWFDGVGTDGNTAQDSYANAVFPSEMAVFGSAAFPNSNYLVGQGYGVFFFRGLTSNADAQQLTAQIWRHFEPRRILVPVSAASTFKAAWARNRNSILGAGARAS